MPLTALKNLAKKSGKSLYRIEKYWKEATKLAKDAGKEGNYGYITRITQRMAYGVGGGDLPKSVTSSIIQARYRLLAYYNKIAGEE